jgi:hypothetical protein
MVGLREIKKAIFGYSKKDVINYIDGLKEELVQKMYDKDREVRYIMDENDLLKKQLQIYKEREDLIIKAVINVDNTIAVIIKKTEEDAEKVKDELIKQQEIEKGKLEMIRKEIGNVESEVREALKDLMWDIEKEKLSLKKE